MSPPPWGQPSAPCGSAPLIVNTHSTLTNSVTPRRNLTTGHGRGPSCWARARARVVEGLLSRTMDGNRTLAVAKLATLDLTALTELGNLTETFVVGELRKRIPWLDEAVASGHWRTQEGDEVDFVMEFDDGRVLAFEVKASERISGADFRGLRKLRDALGERLIAGVAFNTGLRSYTFEDRLHVMPLDRLWRPVCD